MGTGCEASSHVEVENGNWHPGIREAAFRERLSRQDPAAWNLLASRYQADLIRIAQHFAVGCVDPRNAVGETWLRAFQSARSYDPSRPPLPWLVRICRNVYIDQCRHLGCVRTGWGGFEALAAPELARGGGGDPRPPLRLAAAYDAART